MSNSPEMQALAERLAGDSGIFTGGPIEIFEAVGRDCLLAMLQHGLLPSHRVLDFGCGSLRVGYWLIRLLEPDGYYGIDPVKIGVDAGLRQLVGPNLQALKRPRFSFNADCNMDVFGVKFDYVLARSVLTHSMPGSLRRILESFSKVAAPDGVMLATYWRADGDCVHQGKDCIAGDHWDQMDDRFVPCVKFSFRYVQRVAADAGLEVQEFREWEPLNYQIWLCFRRSSGVHAR